MNSKLINLLSSISLVLVLTVRVNADEFRMTFKVVDESGKPMANAKVGASFLQSKLPVPITAKDIVEKQIDLLTDTNGQAVISAFAYDRHIWYGVDSVPGYYSCSGGELKFDDGRLGRWQPWNPTIKFVLKPIGNRVPMYAKKLGWDTFLPETNKPIGYDLQIGDWVGPYGKGITPDFVFTLDRHFTSVTQDFDATLALTFPNDGAGIQSVMADSTGSSFRIPRLAPTNDYEPKLVLQMYRKDGKSIVGVSANTGQNYFFRIRTKKDDQGNIVSAMYGKIYGGIGWDIFHSPVAQLQFTYYLNPTPNDRNVEFDPMHNLMKNLNKFEGVSAP